MIQTKITGSCIVCNKIYQLNHSAPIKPSDNQIKKIQSSEKCPDCIDSHLRSILNFHWTGTDYRSDRGQHSRPLKFDYAKSSDLNFKSIKTSFQKERVYFIDCYSFTNLQLENILKSIKNDMGLEVRNSCDAVAIALFESLNEGTFCLITNTRDEWVHMVLQIDEYFFDLEGKHSEEVLLRRWFKRLENKDYFIKSISIEYAYNLMDWRMEEEKNWLKDELYERIKYVKPAFRQMIIN